jgi:hypothetical protein
MDANRNTCFFSLERAAYMRDACTYKDTCMYKLVGWNTTYIMGMHGELGSLGLLLYPWSFGSGSLRLGRT